MPIRFRCSYCNRLLGIATRKAGTRTTCPHCAHEITVPVPGEDDSKTERLNLEDVEALLGKTAVVAQESAVAAPPAPPPVPAAIQPEFEEPLSLPPAPAPKKASPAAAKPQAPGKPAAKPAPKPPKKQIDPNDPPLFEGDVDELLGVTAAPEEPAAPEPKPTSGLDAMSLGDSHPRTLTLGSQTATLLMALVAVLMALAFAAGYVLAPKG